MQYREYTPRAELRNVVRCFWALRGPGEPDSPERVIPDGCAEIVLNRSSPFRRLAHDGTSRRQSRVLLVGQLRTAISIAPEGDVDLLGIRFQPAGLYALLGIPMHPLTDLDTDVGQAEAQIRQRLRDAVFRASHEAQVRAAEHALLMHLQSNNRSRRTDVTSFVTQELERTTRTIGEIASELGVGRRRLERAFRREVGLSPRHFVRIRRLQSVLRRLERGVPPRGWAHLAAETGYFDQSHLIREFHTLAGTTPGRYAREQNTLNDLFAS